MTFRAQTLVLNLVLAGSILIFWAGVEATGSHAVIFAMMAWFRLLFIYATLGLWDAWVPGPGPLRWQAPLVVARPFVTRAGDSEDRSDQLRCQAMLASPDAGTVVTPRNVMRSFEKPTWRSAWQVVTTAVGLVCAWLITNRAMAISLPLGAASTLLISIFVVRAFIIFHDCGHGSFSRSRRVNTVVGTAVGIVVFTPYVHWTRLHIKHHATTGDLDRRGDGDVWTMTTDEFRAATPGKRRYYRLYHNPVFLLSIGPMIKFALVQRRVTEPRATPRRPKVSVYATNAGIAVFATLMVLWMGPVRYVEVQLMVLLGAGVPAVYLFYVQHCFEGTYWRRHSEWDYAQASLKSSSRLVLPGFLRWVTGNIGYHHIHHLAPRIPNYRLPEAQDACPDVQPGSTITLRSSFATLKANLWDEAEGRYVSFTEAGF